MRCLNIFACPTNGLSELVLKGFAQTSHTELDCSTLETVSASHLLSSFWQLLCFYHFSHSSVISVLHFLASTKHFGCIIVLDSLQQSIVSPLCCSPSSGLPDCFYAEMHLSQKALFTSISVCLYTNMGGKMGRGKYQTLPKHAFICPFLSTYVPNLFCYSHETLQILLGSETSRVLHCLLFYV